MSQKKKKRGGLGVGGICVMYVIGGQSKVKR